MVIDNAIPIGLQNWIDSTMSSEQFPWHFTPEATKVGDGCDGFGNATPMNSGFNNIIYMDEPESNGPYVDLLLPILYIALGDRKLQKLIRIRAGMFIRNQTKNAHLPHIDLPNTEGDETLIYYVNNSDGPTNIWKNEQIVKKVEMKKGRLLKMDGNTFHSSSSPIDSPIRIVVNFNFIAE